MALAFSEITKCAILKTVFCFFRQKNRRKINRFLLDFKIKTMQKLDFSNLLFLDFVIIKFPLLFARDRTEIHLQSKYPVHYALNVSV